MQYERWLFVVIALAGYVLTTDPAHGFQPIPPYRTTVQSAAPPMMRAIAETIPERCRSPRPGRGEGYFMFIRVAPHCACGHELTLRNPFRMRLNVHCFVHKFPEPMTDCIRH